MPEGSPCKKISEAAEQTSLLEKLRPEIEFFRTVDGFHYTMLIQVKKYDVTYFDCGSVFRVQFIPKTSTDGSVFTGSSEIYTVDKQSGAVKLLQLE
jgi:hypothetical protein